MMYELLCNDIPVFKIGIKGSEKGICSILAPQHMPPGLTLTEKADFDSRLANYDGFNHWCAARVLPADRRYAEEVLKKCGLCYGPTDRDRAEIGIATRCLSPNDCYWIRSDGEDISWDNLMRSKNVLKYRNEKSERRTGGV